MANSEWYIGMSEKAIRQKVADTALSLLGVKEGTAEHKRIIDIYNAQRKLPKNYAMSYSDPWCAATMTYIGIILEISNIILPECSCSRMIKLYDDKGRWMEADDYVPDLGDVVMFDWDAVKGECTGAPEHTGMIVDKKGNTLMVLEGNYDNQVKIREICVEYIKVRGYCLPDYAALVQPFKDVPSDHIHADGIAWGAEQGVVLGVGGGLFEPDRPVTRGELMTILHRLSK